MVSVSNVAPLSIIGLIIGVIGLSGNFPLPVNSASQPNAENIGIINLSVEPLSKQSTAAFFFGFTIPFTS